MKTIDTLIDDILDTVRGLGGWEKVHTDFLRDLVGSVAHDRFAEKQVARGYLSMSSLGSPCDKRSWLTVNKPEHEYITSEMYGNFFYGDLLEALLVALAKASGHTVTHLQHKVEFNGVPGSLDCYIDGCHVDVKTASDFSFKKFANHELEQDDPFGYLNQQTGYMAANRDDPDLLDKDHCYFFAINKNRFDLVIDKYNVSDRIDKFHDLIEEKKALIEGPEPEKPYKDIKDGAAGNRKLDTECRYCFFKQYCWPGLRVFKYARGETFLTKVVRTPDVPEITDYYFRHADKNIIS